MQVGLMDLPPATRAAVRAKLEWQVEAGILAEWEVTYGRYECRAGINKAGKTTLEVTLVDTDGEH